MALEHGLGNGLEERLLGPGRRLLAAADRGQRLARAGPCLVHVDIAEIADDLPHPFAAMLTVDEEALASRGRYPDAEAPELSVAEFIRGLARRKRPYSGVGEGGSRHVSSPGFGCSREANGCGIRSPVAEYGRENDPLSTG